jgi:hypothetical protein
MITSGFMMFPLLLQTAGQKTPPGADCQSTNGSGTPIGISGDWHSFFRQARMLEDSVRRAIATIRLDCSAE